MVLRKPYAFLIKNFKLIHIILTILMFIFFLRMRGITNFLESYTATATYEQMSGVVSEYIGVLGMILPLLIIAINILILSLLRMKDKPVKFYWFSILAYVIEMIIMIVAYTVLNNIQQGTATVTFTEIFRDLIGAISYLTVPFIIISLGRGVGFNIKQFNFKKDLMELNIVDEDSEEFEVEVDVDTEDLKAKLNRKIRFIKYVYLENKPFFYILTVILVLGIIFGVYSYISKMEKIYDEGYSFSAYGANLKVENSYKTKYGCDGNLIRKDKFYVIVELNAKNLYQQDMSLPYDYIYLRVDEHKKYSPIDNYKDEFSDFGLRFISSDKMKSEEERQIVLVYEIDNEYFDNNFRLEYITSTVNEEDSSSYKYIKINLKVKEFIDVEKVDEKKIGDTLEFKNSLIDGTRIKIEEVDFNKRYNYKYKELIGSEEKEFVKAIIPTDTTSYKKVVMRLKSEITKNPELNPRIYSSLFEKFVTIEYELDGKTIKQKPQVIDLTPSNSEYTYLEVVTDVSTANKVTLVFTIRDKEYKYIVVAKEQK